MAKKNPDSRNIFKQFEEFRLGEQLATGAEVVAAVAAMSLFVKSSMASMEWLLLLMPQMQKVCAEDAACTIGSLKFFIETSLPELAGMLTALVLLNVLTKSLPVHFKSEQGKEKDPWNNLGIEKKLLYIGRSMLAMSLILGTVYSGLHALLQGDLVLQASAALRSTGDRISTDTVVRAVVDEVKLDIIVFLGLVPGFIYLLRKNAELLLAPKPKRDQK